MGDLYRLRITLLLASPVGRACGCKKVALHRVQPMGGASPRQDSRNSRRAPGQVRPGSGLGLALVREIAIAHDWTVSRGQGSAGGASFSVRWRP
jgi:hypothetical protein